MAVERIFSPPTCVKGMKTLDRTLFLKNVDLPAIKVPTKQCSLFLNYFKKKALRHSNIKSITEHREEGSKILLLRPEECFHLTEEEKEWIYANNGTITKHQIILDFKHYSFNDILRAVLPLDQVQDVPTSFEQVGHIAHLNLREDQLPYKDIIGQVLLDKQPGIETVVNKVTSIDETFRFFKMELLAGRNDMIATVKENGCTFTFDFSKVYWNSRLHTEHKRILDTLKAEDVVVDMFAGVGPFAIPACCKGCMVYANDLNPYSYSALVSNAKNNRVAEKLKPYCLDARDFLRTVISDMIASYQPSRSLISHVIMNLPASAVEFLDTFKGLFSPLPGHLRSTALPQVHCYYFSKAQDPEYDSIKCVQQHLGCNLTEGSYKVFRVRDVSPGKLMMRISFSLPPSVAYWEEGEVMEDSKKGTKRVIEESDREGLGCHTPPAKRGQL